MTSSAMLIVTMEAPADMEDEFNDWYDLEHFPQRQSLPGFAECSRWVCLEGWPRYLALYEIESVAAVKTPEYLACSGSGATPWSRRVLPRTIGRLRVVARDIASAGQRIPVRESRLLAARYPTPDDTMAMAVTQTRLPGLTLIRCLREERDLWVLACFDRPVPMATLIDAFGVVGEVGATLFNVYAPYRRGP